MPDLQLTGTLRPGILPRLTGIRGVAAVAVVLFHYRFYIFNLFPEMHALNPWLSSGNMGVDLFFILSGFILGYNYLHQFEQISPDAWGRFLWLRLARIYPVHIFTLGVLTILIFVAHRYQVSLHSDFSLEYWVKNVLLIQAWAGISDRLSWNFPSWSISAEWFAYLLFPATAGFLLKIRRPAAMALAALIPYVLGSYFIHTADDPTETALLRIGSEFTCGCLLYRVFSEDNLRAPPPLLTAIAVIMLLTFSEYPLVRFASLPLLALLILGLAQHDDGFLSGRRSIFWGEASYSLYMVHAIWWYIFAHTINVPRWVASTFPIRLGILLIYIVCLGGSAAAVYMWIECPSRRWMRGFQPFGDAAANVWRSRSNVGIDASPVIDQRGTFVQDGTG